MEPFFSIWLKELNPFQYYWKNWTLFNIWLEDLNICSIELFQYDSKDEIFPIWFEELNPPFWWFTDLTFLVKWVKYLNPFWTWLKELNFFSSDSHSWALFFNWLTEWNFFRMVFFEITFRMVFFWKYDSKNFFLTKNSERIERIEPFLDITQKKLTDWTFFWQYDSKNFFLLNLTERIVPSFFHDSNTWTFFTWLK